MFVQASVQKMAVLDMTAQECIAGGAGGAFFIAGNMTFATLTRMKLEKNRAAGVGGAVSIELPPLEPAARLQLSGLSCTGNAAQAGGGCVAVTASANASSAGMKLLVLMSNSTLKANEGADRGGGMLLQGTSSTELSMSNVTFALNKAGFGQAVAAGTAQVST